MCPSAKARYWLICGMLVALGLAGAVALVVIQFIKDQKSEVGEKAKQGQIVQLLHDNEGFRVLHSRTIDILERMEPRLSGPTLSAATDFRAAIEIRKSLRQSISDLVDEMRRNLDSIGPNPTEDEDWRMSQQFVTDYYARLRELKDRLRNVLGRSNVANIGLPMGSGNIRRIIDDLDREGQAVPEDVPEMTLAERRLKELPRAENFRLEILNFVSTVREIIRQYHESTEADAEVDEEIRQAVLRRMVKMQDRLRSILRIHIAFNYEMFSVRGMDRNLTTLEDYAMSVPESVPPS
jgi:hypothetical protein